MSWQTSGSAYDPAKFYPDGVMEGKGFKSDLRIRIPDEMFALIEKIAHDNDFPQLDSNSQFARDAFVRGIANYFHFKERGGWEIDPQMERSFKTMLAGMRIREMAARRKHVTESIDELETELRTASPIYRIELIERATEMLDGAWHQEHIDRLEAIVNRNR